MRKPLNSEDLLTRHVVLPDAAASEALGACLASGLPADTAGWLITLDGELGAGKTTLVRAILRGLGHRGAVPSPTYTLVEPYELSGRLIYHIDLYRLSGEEELEYLGWPELRDGLVLVEWPERAPTLTAAADVAIHLSYAGEGREAAIAARGAAVPWLAALRLSPDHSQ